MRPLLPFTVDMEESETPAWREREQAARQPSLFQQGCLPFPAPAQADLRLHSRDFFT